MPWVARSCVACVVGLAVAMPATALPAAPRSAAPTKSADVSPAAEPAAPSTTPADVHLLMRRAELRRAVGDDDGAVALLADALEKTLDARLDPRVQADIRLALLEIHETAKHDEIAARVRDALLRDRDLLQLTPDEVEMLRRGAERSKPAAAPPKPKPESPPAPTTGRGTSSVVEEKVIESEVFSDRKMISGGIGLTTVGLGFGLGGAVLLIYARATENSLDEFDIPEQEDERKRAISDGNAQNGAGIAFVAIGGVLVLAGVILTGVGYGRKRKRLGKRKQDEHSKPRVGASPSGIEVRF